MTLKTTIIALSAGVALISIQAAAQEASSGTFKLPSGFEYTGEWVDGRMEGKGVAKYPNGSTYEGAFKDGAPPFVWGTTVIRAP